MNQKIFEIGRSAYFRYPQFQPLIEFMYRKFFLKPKFSGWGMTTEHELPWKDLDENNIFSKASIDVKNFEFTKKTAGINKKNVDTLLWRHWIIYSSAKYAIEFSNSPKFNFVECGVGDGISAFFALVEIATNKKSMSNFSMHLYDSWDEMRERELIESEKNLIGKYSNLNIEITQKNLDKFSENVIYHQGYIPDSFETTKNSPELINYLHIDLNSSLPTIKTLEYFFPRLERGGVIIFDDYGWSGYSDTKKTVDSFFNERPGIFMKLPTGQAVYYR